MPPSAETQLKLQRLYLRNGYAVRPVDEAILRHPRLHTGPRMVKPPVVQAAGMLRAVGRGIDTTAWGWLCDQAGQLLFIPPNVSGWDDARWLDTATVRARWQMATAICNPAQLDERAMRGKVPADAAELVRRAAAFWGTPLSPATRAALERYASDALTTATER